MKIFIVSPFLTCKNEERKSILKNRLYRLFDRLIKAKILKTNNSLNDLKIIGVDGDNYNPELNELLSDNWNNSFLRFLSGTKGCSLSHMLILKYIDKYNIHEDILVLEDDACIIENFLELIPNKFPEDYDIFHMHSFYQKNYDIQPIQWSDNIKKISNNLKENIEGPWGAYTYFINGRNIKKIIKETIPLEWQVDYSLTGGSNPNINTYILNPKFKASGDESVSYRKILNKDNIVYSMKIQESEPYILGYNTFLTLKVHETMINDVQRENLFNFYIEDSNQNINLINSYIDLIFPELYEKNKNDMNFVKFKIKENNNLFKYGKNFKLYILYSHPEGIHGLDADIRKTILKNRNPLFNQHILNPNSSQELVLLLNITIEN